jgi:formate hydrogenlyase subunit 6/NADH:ubiquinone oxidoreductase subunit I
VGNFRGVHRLNRDEAGRVRCVACFMCSTACPADCIHIEGAASPWDDREKYPVKFDIDELRCIFCGMCEEACPVDAIELTQAYDVIGLSRLDCIHLHASKRECGSRVDRHEHVGLGEIGARGLAALVRQPRLAHLPMILETPKGTDQKSGREFDAINLGKLRRYLRKR